MLRGKYTEKTLPFSDYVLTESVGILRQLQQTLFRIVEDYVVGIQVRKLAKLALFGYFVGEISVDSSGTEDLPNGPPNSLEHISQVSKWSDSRTRSSKQVLDDKERGSGLNKTRKSCSQTIVTSSM